MEFNSIKIKDTNIELIDGDRGKNYPKNHEMMDSGHTLFLNNKNIAKNFLDDSFGNFITEDKSDSLRKGKLCRNDIVLSTRGSVGNIGFYHSKIQMNHIRINSGMIILRNNDKKFLDEYLYIFLRSPYMQNKFKEFISGSVQNHLPIRDLQQIEIMYPPIYYQSYIIKIIMNIEEKIKINNEIIANLEELSQTLFKRWFVDFEFPNEDGNPYKSSGGEMIDSELGEIPRGWEVNELGTYVDIIKGLSYKGAFLDKEHERSDSFPLLSISNFNFIAGFKGNKTKYYFGDYKERHLVNSGDILIAATDLTQDRKILGAPAIVPNLNKTMIFSLDVFKITETTIPKYVLYFLLQSAKYREFVEGSATGTTVIRIAKNIILKVPIVIDKDISLNFDNLIKPYMEKIEHLSQENKKLTELRDTLLPKLMSGEIEIPDDIEVNEDELSI
ncbi:restriction endonuclease subunit S [Mammaliicoccus sp. P-M56]|uniref:restriction endonuclease subunit S n=1 Tax=Mammaliicoccus sp. P-M56 TaxID=2898715 RepID=UPI001EFAA201|nr:restriction endonuclease subunit S [Mammaliicoccus sp. P-M56]